ncbi:MAG: LLM class flavin-dependent oxidoreductase [Jatrophihabitans sp.]|uniref:LLM class flavin-dependent oxidoreductase n=1 Tax=Jatrophihabitans sp. TaxID=1932789 RepID=UPI003F7F505E
MTVQLGVVFVPTLAPEQLPALARAADAAGLDECWVWEDCFKESGIASAAVALAVTERIRVGIGLMPAPLRSVALTAMEIQTLARIFPGRLLPGIGHGVQSWMDQVGARPASPLTLLDEYATNLRALLAGERVTTQGRAVRLDDVALDWPPTTLPPLLIGGGGPKTVALAARLGDGTLLGTTMTDDEIRDAVALIEQHVTRRPHTVWVQLIAATGPGAADRLAHELTTEWNRPTDRGIGVAGDAATIAAAVDRLAGLGVTSVAIEPTADEPDLLGFVRFLGEEVRPLLSA